MKINRSSKLYFKKWLTQQKKNQIKIILAEYSKIVNYFITTYRDQVPGLLKKELLLAKHTQLCIINTSTWLTARMVKNAFTEGYGMLQSYKSNLKNDKSHSLPKHTGKKAHLSCTTNTQSEDTHTVEFDFNLILGSIGNKFKISIPLKKHKQFNRWNSVGKRSSTVVLTDSYIQFSFEINVPKKKTVGSKLGIDIGLNKLLVTNVGEIYGEKLRSLIDKLRRKRQKSKAYYRCLEEIKEYINKCCKDFYDEHKDLYLIVVEALKKVKYKMKLKRRLSRNMRRVIHNWNYAYVLERLQRLSEENRVSFRSVNPRYTSVQCSSCNYIDKKNRQSQERFYCQSCGYSDNADINASKNILSRFLTGTYGFCFQT